MTDPTNTPELLPCPFCGYDLAFAEGICYGEADDNGIDPDTGQREHPTGICCSNCAAYMVGGDTDEDATTSWNTRPQPAVTVKPLDFEPLRQWGFAPGSYLCFCSDCSKQHTADKRAWRCLTCAEATLSAIQPTPTADSNLQNVHITHAQDVRAEALREAAEAVEEITGWQGQPHCSSMDYGPTTASKCKAAILALIDQAPTLIDTISDAVWKADGAEDWNINAGAPTPVAVVQRCGDCDCAKGGSDCNWIKPGPEAPTPSPTPQEAARVLLEHNDGFMPNQPKVAAVKAFLDRGGTVVQPTALNDAWRAALRALSEDQ